MEQIQLFRDYQEQVSTDHSGLQRFAQVSKEHLVYDAVTKSRRFSGFTTIKSAQAELQIAAGRFYDVLGVVYNRNATVTQNMLAMLPATNRKIVIVAVSGAVTESEVTERDFIVDVETRRTEPRAVTTVESRDAVISFLAGQEAIDPVAPSVPSSSCAIASVLLDSTQVVSVTMLTDNEIASTEELDLRLNSAEAFDAAIGPRVTALASDLAALQAQMGKKAQINLPMLYQDLARLKTRVGLPETTSAYGADAFLNPNATDKANAQALGIDCLVENGVRFNDANTDEAAITIFSQNDPAAHLQDGFLLPAYTDILKLSTGPVTDSIGIAQYGFQTIDMVQGYIANDRIRYGGRYLQCSNGVHWAEGGETPAPVDLIDFATWDTYVPTGAYTDVPDHHVEYYDVFWHDSWKTPYWYAVKTDHHITGAHVGQTFLNANDLWATKVGFYIADKPASENIYISICEVIAGQPDRSKVIQHVTVLGAAVTLGWNRVTIPPTLLARGARYAVMFTANANYRIGTTSGQNYTDGTFFYSTDGAYGFGDLTKDIALEIWGALFNSPQSTIEFGALNLDGGMRSIDLLAPLAQPESTQLIYEIKLPGADWMALSRFNPNLLATAPPLVQFRGRFLGTRDIQPGISLSGSRYHIARPKVALKHVSAILTRPTTSEVYVKLTLERFDDTPHNCTCVLYYAAGEHNPVLTEDVVVDSIKKITERTFKFTPAGITSYTIIIYGATNSANSMWHVAERVDWVI